MRKLEDRVEKDFFIRFEEGWRGIKRSMVNKVGVCLLAGVLGLGLLPEVKAPLVTPSSAYAQEKEKVQQEEIKQETVPLKEENKEGMVPLVPLISPPESKAEGICETVKECEAKGQRFLEEGDYEKAVESFLRLHNLADKENHRPIFLYYIAVSYERGGEPEKAIEYYDRYLEEDPYASQKEEIERKKPGLFLYVKGKELYEKGKFGEAVNFLEEARKMLSLEGVALEVLCLETASCYEERASGYGEKGEYEDALKHYQSCLELARGKGKERVKKKIEELIKLKRELVDEEEVVDEEKEEKVASLPLVEISEREEKEERPFWERYSWGIIGGSGVVSLGGFVYGMMCDSSANEKFKGLVRECGEEGCVESRIKEVEREIKGKVRARNVSYGIAAGAGVVGLGFLGWKYLKKPEVPEKEGEGTGAYFQLDLNGFKMGFEF